MANNKIRIGIAALTFSAAGLVGLVAKEGYTDKAVIPVKGDVPTVGFGSTYREDGSKVQIGDFTTPQKALSRTLTHIQKDERGLKACVREPLTPVEYDILVGFSYQYGVYATCKSGIVKNINEKKYLEACSVYLEYSKIAKGTIDCTIRSNNCFGVVIRNNERYDKCMGEQD